MTDILSTADDYVTRKMHISLLERPDNLPTLDQLKDELKAHIRGGSDLTVDRLDKATGELTPALELPEQNVRLFLRETDAIVIHCWNCGTQNVTRKASTSLITESLGDMRALDAEQRAGQYQP